MIDGGGSVTPTLLSKSVAKWVSAMKGDFFYIFFYHSGNSCLKPCVFCKKKQNTNSGVEGVSVRFNDTAGGWGGDNL